MAAIRTFWRSNRLAVALIFALALSVKMLVPQGFMFGEVPGTRYLSVQLCYDGVSHQTARIAIPGEGDPNGGQSGPDQHCPFAALATGALGAADLPVVEPAAVIPARNGIPAPAAWYGPSVNLPPPSRGPPASV